MPDGIFRDNMLTIKLVIPVTSVADPLSCTLPQAPVLEGAGHHYCEGERGYKQTKKTTKQFFNFMTISFLRRNAKTAITLILYWGSSGCLLLSLGHRDSIQEYSLTEPTGEFLGKMSPKICQQGTHVNKRVTLRIIFVQQQEHGSQRLKQGKKSSFQK